MMNGLVLDLFPGLELLGRAFREVGFCVVSGPDKLLGEDVRDFHPPAGRFDGVIGGSPCQAFSSLANLVRAKALKSRGLVLMPGPLNLREVADAKTGEVVFTGTPHEIGEWLGLAQSLVPEFERVVEEASPLWFLHENVPAAPVPSPAGYRVQDFTVCNSSIPGEDGLGQEQERVRRFTFGWRLSGSGELYGTAGVLKAPNLLRWIPRAALRLPACTGAVTSPQHHRGKRDREKGWGEPRPGRVRVGAVSRNRSDNSPGAKGRVRTSAVVADSRETPVAIGGSGKTKARLRQPGVTYDDGPGTRDKMLCRAVSSDEGGQRDSVERRPGSTPSRDLAEMLRLQGLPEDLLEDAPFTAKAKRRLVANGVPMPLGRAVAQAVVEALRTYHIHEPKEQPWDRLSRETSST